MMGAMPMMMAGKGGMPNPGMMGQMMGKGGMPGMQPGGPRPPMPQQAQPRPQSQMAPGPGPSPTPATEPGVPLTAAALAAAHPGMQKQMLGEKLFPSVAKFQPELAGKITGMMLEMDNSELLMLLESDAQLKNKVDEALRVLQTVGK